MKGLLTRSWQLHAYKHKTKCVCFFNHLLTQKRQSELVVKVINTLF